ncbi:MAG: acyl-CoA desaturase, partial [Hymenobacteraceae bacterium]|nr:acyl-CoA desaturase [Hymenobacteraceae bacterium]MDX5396830.1 acyl-CoA desaturase [Hymenobacteraceae bacterium]MDX5512901.1 acyl-CoA desaturase [Hymenobacteraceae bacterium]
MIIIVFFVLHWYLSLFVQTFFLHRYAAHKMFTMNKFWERFFYLFTYLCQGSSYLSPRAYAILHRMHHAFSDTEKDPHSPHYYTNAFSMMWQTKNIYNDVLNHRVEPESRFEGNYPVWNAIEKIGDSWYSRAGWGTAYVLFYITFATEWWMFLLLPIHFLMGPVHGA